MVGLIELNCHSSNFYVTRPTIIFNIFQMDNTLDVHLGAYLPNAITNSDNTLDSKVYIHDTYYSS